MCVFVFLKNRLDMLEYKRSEKSALTKKEREKIIFHNNLLLLLPLLFADRDDKIVFECLLV